MFADDKLLKTDERKQLTSDGRPPYDAVARMETENPIPKRKDNRKASYPLRFRTKGQKERIERAARRSGKSLREFILSHAETAANAVLNELRAV